MKVISDQSYIDALSVGGKFTNKILIVISHFLFQLMSCIFLWVLISSELFLGKNKPLQFIENRF
jgi:hypothetical protein